MDVLGGVVIARMVMVLSWAMVATFPMAGVTSLSVARRTSLSVASAVCTIVVVGFVFVAADDEQFERHLSCYHQQIRVQHVE